MNYKIVGAALGIATSLAVAGPAHAEVGWSIGAGAARTDNATRVPQNTVSDTILNVGGELALSHESRRVTAEFKGFGQYLEYADDTFENDFQSSAFGSLVFGIVPDRFVWNFEDTFGQITIDQFRAVTPDNRQNVNSFTTGPDLILRLGTQSIVRFAGRFGDTRYEDSKFANDQRLSGSVAFVRQTSASASWSLTADTTRVEFDLPGGPGYDQQTVYASLNSRGARQSLSLDIGMTRLADAGDSQSYPYIGVAWKRQITPSWKLDVNVSSGFRNTGDRFAEGAAYSERGTDPVNTTNVPSESHTGRAGLTFERPRTSFKIQASYSSDNYVMPGEVDLHTLTIATDVGRQFSERLRGFANLSYEERDFSAARDADATTIASIGLDLRIGRTVFLTTGYRHEKRLTDFVLASYTDNIIFVSISHRQGSLLAP